MSDIAMLLLALLLAGVIISILQRFLDGLSYVWQWHVGPWLLGLWERLEHHIRTRR